MHYRTEGKLRSFFNRFRSLVILASVLILVVGGFFMSNTITHAASYCQVTYSVTNQWAGGFGGSITVQNTSGSAWSSWNLGFTFPASGQAITQGWNGTFSQSGQNVTVANMSYNGAIAPNGSINPGFNATWTGSNPVPTSFTVNGNACNGGGSTPTPGTTPTPGVTPTPRSTPTPGVTPTPSGGGCNVAPVDPQATRQARNLLCYLYSVYGNHILSGQQESPWNQNGEMEMSYIYSLTGKYPAIRAMDYGDSQTWASRAIPWWQAGGIDMVSYHMGAPGQPVDGWTGAQLSADINAVLTPGTAQYQSFISRLDGSASQLAQAQAAGVPIIWRPFHEAGGTWFWWSKQGGSQYVRLWKFMFNYYTNVKGLHNLIWLLPFDGQPDASFWPGKAYVDIAGSDTYAGDHSPQTGLYNATRNIVGGTIPIALHENGPIPDPSQLQSSGTKWVFFNTWHTTWITDTSVNPQSLIRTVYSSPYVITRDRVPNLK
jgi:hypothetical protein